MQCYPETVMPGDSIYYLITAKNLHDESIYILDYFMPISTDIQTRLKDIEGQEQSLFFESVTNIEFDRSVSFAEIKPGNFRIIGVLAICVPPLEDLKEPFWEKHLKKISVNGEKFLLCVTVDSRGRLNEAEVRPIPPIILEVPITIKPRPENEMVMIENWHEKTPQKLFPMPPGQPTGERFQRKVPKDFMVPGSNVISLHGWNLIYGKKYSQWHFIRFGNRYPADPNAPETWQGWKKLEDSLTPSTMRDEIRLTRILIQYCDTKDEKVLTELKEWFNGMNEIQRTVMVKNVHNLVQSCSRNEVLLPLFRDIYHAIRQYDIADKPELSLKHLRDLGLIE